MVELQVSEIKHTCALVEMSRRERCSKVELRRLPPEPLQFQAKCVMAPAAPCRPAPEPGRDSSEAIEEQNRQYEAVLDHEYHLDPE